MFTGRVQVFVNYHTLGLTKYFSDLSLEDTVVMTEDNCHCSPSHVEEDISPCDDAVKEDLTGNSLVLSSLDRLCMNSCFDKSNTVTLSLDSRYNNQETDINEQNVERKSTGKSGRYM